MKGKRENNEINLRLIAFEKYGETLGKHTFCSGNNFYFPSPSCNKCIMFTSHPLNRQHNIKQHRANIVDSMR